jgi:CheY-like chemotaxis protein
VTVLLPATDNRPFDYAVPERVEGHGRRSTTEARATLESVAGSQRSVVDRGTVLVIDDEPSVRAVARRILERAGYAVLAAERGPVGLNLYRAHAPEIAAVLLDLTMPEMSGEEVYRALQVIDPAARVVVMSGFSAEEMRERFPRGTPIVFVQKPFTQHELEAALRDISRASR